MLHQKCIVEEVEGGVVLTDPFLQILTDGFIRSKKWCEVGCYDRLDGDVAKGWNIIFIKNVLHVVACADHTMFAVVSLVMI